ncbi:MAG: tetratricopeptide repeat protein [Bryobacterales bacterium]|nr:tetratricopeptide repeat protein [Bryobacterales bacterium]
MLAGARSRVLFLSIAALAASGQAQLIDRTSERSGVDPAASELSAERRGDIYMARKMYREASDTYKEALRREPDSAKLINKLGISYHQLLMLGSARREYERAWRADKTYGQALNNLGAVHHAEGNYGKAVRAYKRALKISPYSASIHSNLGTSHFARGKYKLATQAYLKALDLDPNVFETKAAFGTMLQERSVGNRGKYYYFMAKAYAGAEIWERAVLYIRKAIEEGFASPRKVAAESTFKPMHELPEFQRIAFPETMASAGSPPKNP